MARSSHTLPAAPAWVAPLVGVLMVVAVVFTAWLSRPKRPSDASVMHAIGETLAREATVGVPAPPAPSEASLKASLKASLPPPVAPRPES